MSNLPVNTQPRPKQSQDNGVPLSIRTLKKEDPDQDVSRWLNTTGQMLRMGMQLILKPLISSTSLHWTAQSLQFQEDYGTRRALRRLARSSKIMVQLATTTTLHFQLTAALKSLLSGKENAQSLSVPPLTLTAALRQD